MDAVTLDLAYARLGVELPQAEAEEDRGERHGATG